MPRCTTERPQHSHEVSRCLPDASLAHFSRSLAGYHARKAHGRHLSGRSPWVEATDVPARRTAGGSRRGLTGRAAREGQPPARLLAALRLAGVPPQRWRAAQRGPFERPFPPSIDPFDRPWPRIFPYLRYLRKIRHHLYTPFSHHLILEPFIRFGGVFYPCIKSVL